MDEYSRESLERFTSHGGTGIDTVTDNCQKLSFTFSGVNIILEEKSVLNDVCGYVHSGQMLALMGPSGSGKTTLLNFLSRRTESIGSHRCELRGDVRFNGFPLKGKGNSQIGYVMQSECFFEELTLEETLYFHARMRLDSRMSDRKKLDHVHELVSLMGLERQMKTKIGGKMVRGLSGGERKRAAIVVELINDPLLLFLDEPTSGLDSTKALMIVTLLRNLALTKHKIIVSSIHQPNVVAFLMFTKVLLLCEGNMAYFGEVKEVEPHFDAFGLACPSGWSIADHIITATRMDSSTRDRIVQFYEPKKREVMAFIKNDKTSDKVAETKSHPVSSAVKFVLLSRRLLKLNFVKLMSPVRALKDAFTALIIGTVWYNFVLNDTSIADLSGLVFYSTVFIISIAFFFDLYQFTIESTIVRREYSSNMYSIPVYVWSKILAELPAYTMIVTCIWVIIYWMADLGPVSYYFYTLLYNILIIVSGNVLGLLVGSFQLPINQAMICGNIYFTVIMLLGGFYSPISVPWIKCFSPIHINYVMVTFLLVRGKDGIPCLKTRERSVEDKPSPLESCRIGLEKGTAVEAMILAGAVTEPYYYLIILISIIAASIVATIFILKCTLNRRSNTESLWKKVGKSW